MVCRHYRSERTPGMRRFTGSKLFTILLEYGLNRACLPDKQACPDGSQGMRRTSHGVLKIDIYIKEMTLESARC